jgi:hypothetical protein
MDGLLGIAIPPVVADDPGAAGMASAVASSTPMPAQVGFAIGPACPAVAMDPMPLLCYGRLVVLAASKRGRVDRALSRQRVPDGAGAKGDLLKL